MKVLVLGASTNPERYAYKAVIMLKENGYDVVPVGIKNGEIDGIPIITSNEIHNNIHTITLYIGRVNQTQWYDYIMRTKPVRIIFNPGTENPELQKMAEQSGIRTEEACTLVMLTTNVFNEF